MPEAKKVAAERDLDKQGAARAAELGLATPEDSRRDGERVPCDVPVVVGDRTHDVPVMVAGQRGSFPARCVNVSRSGVLLALQYGERVSDSTDGDGGFGELLVSLCRHGAQVHFEEPGFALTVELIRAADGEPEEQLLACRLIEPLTAEQRAFFGLPEDA